MILERRTSRVREQPNAFSPQCDELPVHELLCINWMKMASPVPHCTGGIPFLANRNQIFMSCHGGLGKGIKSVCNTVWDVCHTSTLNRNGFPIGQVLSLKPHAVMLLRGHLM